MAGKKKAEAKPEKTPAEKIKTAARLLSRAIDAAGEHPDLIVARRQIEDGVALALKVSKRRQ